MATSSVTAAQQFKAALMDAMVTLVTGQEVLVSFGHPGDEVGNWDDQVSFADIEVTQEFGPMGTNRSRDETLRQTVWVSSFREGGTDQERVAAARAYELLGLLERYVRFTDTTLGGVVRQCFLTSHTSQGFTDPGMTLAGREVDIEAVFTAEVRITGP